MRRNDPRGVWIPCPERPGGLSAAGSRDDFTQFGYTHPPGDGAEHGHACDGAAEQAEQGAGTPVPGDVGGPDDDPSAAAAPSTAAIPIRAIVRRTRAKPSRPKRRVSFRYPSTAPTTYDSDVETFSASTTWSPCRVSAAISTKTTLAATIQMLMTVGVLASRIA